MLYLLKDKTSSLTLSLQLLSPAQLEAFGPDNAELVTSLQRAALGDEQLAALERASTGSYEQPKSTDNTSGERIPARPQVVSGCWKESVCIRMVPFSPRGSVSEHRGRLGPHEASAVSPDVLRAAVRRRHLEKRTLHQQDSRLHVTTVLNASAACINSTYSNCLEK